MNKEKKKIPQRGEIWLVEFSQNKENRKPIRPCLVISNDQQNIYDEEVIVLPLTTEQVIAGEVHFFEIPLANNSSTGLDQPSRILTNRIHTINKELRLIKRLGQVNSKIWEQVWQSLLISLGEK